METKTLEKELLNLERQYWQAIKDKDVDTVLRLSDDPCIVAGSQGCSSIGKEALASMMKSAKYTLNEFRLGEAKTRILSDDVAILAYKVHEELTVEGKPVTLDAADASTWVRRGDGWVCALHTESIAGDPFGRDRRSHV